MLILIHQFPENRYEKLGINALRNYQMLISIPAKILTGFRLHRISKKVSSISPCIKKKSCKITSSYKNNSYYIKKKVDVSKKNKKS